MQLTLLSKFKNELNFQKYSLISYKVVLTFVWDQKLFWPFWSHIATRCLQNPQWSLRSPNVNTMCSSRQVRTGSQSERRTLSAVCVCLPSLFYSLTLMCEHEGWKHSATNKPPQDLHAISELTLGKEAPLCFQTRVKCLQIPFEKQRPIFP